VTVYLRRLSVSLWLCVSGGRCADDAPFWQNHSNRCVLLKCMGSVALLTVDGVIWDVSWLGRRHQNMWPSAPVSPFAVWLLDSLSITGQCHGPIALHSAEWVGSGVH
jgi:hypothetical protein